MVQTSHSFEIVPTAPPEPQGNHRPGISLSKATFRRPFVDPRGAPNYKRFEHIEKAPLHNTPKIALDKTTARKKHEFDKKPLCGKIYENKKDIVLASRYNGGIRYCHDECSCSFKIRQDDGAGLGNEHI